RMARFQSVEDLKDNLDLMIGRRPPLIVQLNRGAGQREDRFAHLLCGEVDLTVAAAPSMPSFTTSGLSELEQRVQTLEETVALLQAEIAALKGH
ncbi:MAG: DUF480 domain-containing protein, partial [Ensifer adhaerens]